MSVESLLANRGLIRGFLVPIFYDEHGRGSALSHEDFCKVREGYACAACLCEYTMYLPRCPVCQHERDVTADLEAPDPVHVSHLQERHSDDVTPVARGFDEFMRSVERDESIEQIPVKKLLPSRWGKK